MASKGLATVPARKEYLAWLGKGLIGYSKYPLSQCQYMVLFLP